MQSTHLRPSLDIKSAICMTVVFCWIILVQSHVIANSGHDVKGVNQPQSCHALIENNNESNILVYQLSYPLGFIVAHFH